ncbi:hypothetical protein ACQY0O_007250 [Thecaphora frezii]
MPTFDQPRPASPAAPHHRNVGSTSDDDDGDDGQHTDDASYATRDGAQCIGKRTRSRVSLASAPIPEDPDAAAREATEHRRSALSGPSPISPSDEQGKGGKGESSGTRSHDGSGSGSGTRSGGGGGSGVHGSSSNSNNNSNRNSSSSRSSGSSSYVSDSSNPHVLRSRSQHLDTSSALVPSVLVNEEARPPPPRASSGPARAFQRARSGNRSIDLTSSPTRPSRQLRASTSRNTAHTNLASSAPSALNAASRSNESAPNSRLGEGLSQCQGQYQGEPESQSQGQGHSQSQTSGNQSDGRVPRQSQASSAMSPPRPTRALPRRTASAMTASRPLPQPMQSNSSSSSSTVSIASSTSSPYALRSRRSLGTSALQSSNSNANVRASGSGSPSNRLTLATDCNPMASANAFNGGGDPGSLSSGASTPRTPLAEIPLWLADMRSESRRSSSSSSSFIMAPGMVVDGDDLSGSYFTSRPGYGRTQTASSSSTSSSMSMSMNLTPASSSGMTTRRSLRDRRPRQSNENDPESMASRYSQESDWSDVQQTPTLGSSAGGGSQSEALSSFSMAQQGWAGGSSSRRNSLGRTINGPLSLVASSPNTPMRQRSSTHRPSLSVPASPSTSTPVRREGGSSSSTSASTNAVLAADRRMRASRSSDVPMDLEVVPEVAGEQGAAAASTSIENGTSPMRMTRSLSRRRQLEAEVRPAAAAGATHAYTALTPLRTLQMASTNSRRADQIDRGHESERHTLPWSPSMPSLTLRSSPQPPSSSQQSDLSQPQTEPASPSASSTTTSMTNASTAAESSVSGSGGMPATPLGETAPGLPALGGDAPLIEVGVPGGGRRARTRASAAAVAAAVIVSRARIEGQDIGLGLQGAEEAITDVKVEEDEPVVRALHLDRPYYG